MDNDLVDDLNDIIQKQADEIERLREELKFTDEVRQRALQSLFAAEKEIKQLQKAQVPERECWLHNNSEALASVERGIADAEAGRLHSLGDFSQYLKDKKESK